MPISLLQADSSPGVEVVLAAIFGVLALVVFGLWVWSIVFAYRDAEKRGKSGVLVGLPVAFLSWPFGLVAWLIFRPDAPRGNASRGLAQEPARGR